jgi:copper chaperone CopZ
MKKSFKIEVDCANCANLVEEAVKKVEGVKDAMVVFVTQKMKIEFEEGVDTEAVMDEVLRVAQKVEPDFCVVR